MSFSQGTCVFEPGHNCLLAKTEMSFITGQIYPAYVYTRPGRTSFSATDFDAFSHRFRIVFNPFSGHFRPFSDRFAWFLRRFFRFFGVVVIARSFSIDRSIERAIDRAIGRSIVPGRVAAGRVNPTAYLRRCRLSTG